MSEIQFACRILLFFLIASCWIMGAIGVDGIAGKILRISLIGCILGALILGACGVFG